MSSPGSVGSSGFSTEFLEGELKRDLEKPDLYSALDIFNIATDPQKVTLIKLCNSQKDGLLHLLATNILNNSEEERDTKFLMDSTLKILKIEDLKKYLKEVVTSPDADEFSFLDLAVFCRNEKLNFVHKILKLIPEEDRVQCQRFIETEEFQDGLMNEDVGTLLGLFHLSEDRQKLSLIKMQDPEKVRLFHLLGMQIIKDQKTRNVSNLINEPLKILKKLSNPRDIKDIVTAKDDDGHCFLDYAVLCKNKKLNFMRELFKLIPKEDQDECHQHIDETDFKKELEAEDLAAALNLFYLSKKSQKASLAKVTAVSSTSVLRRSPKSAAIRVAPLGMRCARGGAF